MKSKILDYIDFERANALLEGFNQSTDFVTAILDLDGNILSKSGWRQICTDFHRKNPETAFNCTISDIELGKKSKGNEKYHFYKCINGLVDVRVPIVIRGEHVANLYSGQFFFEAPDTSFFKKQAEKFEFEESSYLQALGKVPVVTKEKVELAMNFLLEILQVIIEMTVEKIEQKELTEIIRESEAALLKSQAQLKHNMEDLLESQRIAHLGTWRLDLATNQVVWSEELYKMYGFNPTVPPPPYTEHMKLFTPESWDKLSTSLNQTRTLGIPYELELETVTVDGSNGWMWVHGEAKQDSDGNIVSLHGVAQDITERKRAEEQLVYLSYHDHLTGLYNRRFFELALKSIDAEVNLPISIIMFDINGLKLVNDSFGHDSGDALLIKAAETIKKACREEDSIFRIGGDEFVVILPKATTDDALQISNLIKELASKESVANIKLSISSGFDTKTSALQSIAEIIANAENCMYRQKLLERSSMRSKAIDLIMNTLYAKSKREAAHSKRVSNLAMSIGAKMNFNTDAANQLRIAGLIHDIGKISIDEKTLNKPGALSAEERKEIERHPEIGWRLLSSTNEFSELAQIVLNHHEKWDGSGYPNGLKGSKIPLEARIIAVADAYDAMTSIRSYRKALSNEDAVKELTRCSGTQFDPEIVDLFIKQVLSDNVASG
ncbi:MAG: diguanylate cyclase [Clostridia bacterium]|nr:diguanylate cyclase [Clostridia bacterium]